MPGSLSIVLLLGSYDKKTKLILDMVKEEIAKNYSGEVLAFVLSNLDLYDTDKFQVLTETEENIRTTVYIFDSNGFIQEVYDLPLTAGQDQSEVVYTSLKNKFDISKIQKMTTAKKFEHLLTAAQVVFLIRDKEETRGGEYVELMLALFQENQPNLWFFKKEGIHLSSMLMEYMDMFKIIMRTYFDISELKLSVIRVIDNLLSESE